MVSQGRTPTFISFDDYGERIPAAAHLPFVSLGIHCPRPGGKFARKRSQLSSLHRALEVAPSREVTLLSYDPWILMPLHARRGWSVAVVEHNNVDRAETSSLYRSAYRRLPGSIVHLCFEPYIARHIESRYGMSTAVMPHGVRALRPDDSLVAEIRASEGRFVFAPTACPDAIVVRRFAELAAEERLSLLTRAPKGREAEYQALAGNLRLVPHDVHFDSYMVAAEVIGILNEYQFRVSGVFFEGLSAVRPIWIREGLFARHVAGAYSPHPIRVVSW